VDKFTSKNVVLSLLTNWAISRNIDMLDIAFLVPKGHIYMCHKIIRYFVKKIYNLVPITSYFDQKTDAFQLKFDFEVLQLCHSHTFALVILSEHQYIYYKFLI